MNAHHIRVGGLSFMGKVNEIFCQTGVSGIINYIRDHNTQIRCAYMNMIKKFFE